MADVTLPVLVQALVKKGLASREEAERVMRKRGENGGTDRIRTCEALDGPVRLASRCFQPNSATVP
jgi:hypothetical protein